MIGLAWLSKSACDVTALGSVLTLDGKRRVALLLLVTFGGGLALVGLAKSLTARLRSDLLPQAAQIFITSLPSSHATISAAVAVAVVGLTGVSWVHLGSGLIDQSQKMTVAAMQIADMKVCAHRS